MFAFNCSIVDSNRKFSVIWLEANIISAIWSQVNKFTHNGLVKAFYLLQNC